MILKETEADAAVSESGEGAIAPLNGLVLSGGKSRRMGQPKDLMNWHGKQQRYYMADLLGAFCEQVFISCRQQQAEELDPAYASLPDTFLNMGPLGGLLSALRAQRDHAWLVVACDLPLLDEASLELLVSGRTPGNIATAYESPRDQLPEPLITIWEPESYPVLLNFLGQGITCPRKVLINSEIAILQAPDPQVLMNANTPEDAQKARELLNRQKTGSLL